MELNFIKFPIAQKQNALWWFISH